MKILQIYNNLCLHIRLVRIRRKLGRCGNGAYFGTKGLIAGGNNIFVGSKFSVGNFYQLQIWYCQNDENAEKILPQIIIGNNVSAMNSFQISCYNKIEIGSGCLFGDNVFITDNLHGFNTLSELEVPPIERTLYSKGEVIIGTNAWIGRNVCIMPGVKIGNGAIVGANAVVTQDIPANCVAGGVPAKVIRRILS